MAVTIDSADFDRLRTRIARMADVDVDQLLEELGEELAFQTKKRLSDKSAPDGSPWPQRAQAAPHPLLERTRRLAGSIDHRSIQSGVEVGSNLVYAAAQLFGSPKQNIRARPYLGIGADDAEALEEVAVRFLGEAL